MSNFVTRKETLAILNWNTIRFNDIPLLDVDFRKVCKGSELLDDEELFEVLVRMASTRTTPYFPFDKDPKSSDGYYKRIMKLYPKAFNQAPVGDMYAGMMNTSTNTVVMEDAYILYPTFGILPEESFDPEYLEQECNNIVVDGSIESLESFINDMGITSIFVDDIEYVIQLLRRKNVPLTGMTFFVSKLGYNYEYNSMGEYTYKYEDEILTLQEEINFDIGFCEVYKSDLKILHRGLNKLPDTHILQKLRSTKKFRDE